MRLNIVQPSSSASEATFHNFTRPVPGSECVAAPVSDGRVLVYFEGDLYGRGSKRPVPTPTREERTTYAKIAAGRAVENYPTTAKFYVADESELIQTGFVLWDPDIRSLIVRFVEADGSLSSRRNPYDLLQLNPGEDLGSWGVTHVFGSLITDGLPTEEAAWRWIDDNADSLGDDPAYYEATFFGP